MDDAFISNARGSCPITEAARIPAGPRSPRRRQAPGRSRPKAAPGIHEPAGSVDFQINAVNFDDAAQRQNDFADANIGLGCERALQLLDSRIAAGDTGLLPVQSVVRRCLALLSAMPPLSHVGSLPLRPDDRLYECFDQFLSLLRQQECQMQELQTMINELI